MNTRKSSRKDQSTDDDLSYASTSSSSTLTNKASFEDNDCKYCNLYDVTFIKLKRLICLKYVINGIYKY